MSEEHAVGINMVELKPPPSTPASVLLQLASLVVELAEIVAANNWGSAEMDKAHQVRQRAIRMREEIADMVISERTPRS